MGTMSDPTIRQSPTGRTIPTDSRRVAVRVDHYVDHGAGVPVDVPLPLVRLDVLGDGYRGATLTVAQARALAAALHVSAYRATTAARGEG